MHAGRSPRIVVGLPILIAAAFVLTVYADTGAVLYELPRPLLFAAGMALGIQLLASALLRDLRRGSLIAAGITATLIDLRFGLIAIAITIALAYAKRTERTASLGAPVSAVVVAFFALSVVRVVSSEAFVPADLMPVRYLGGAARSLTDPDIYLIMLDGYPRSDTLADFGYDNALFEHDLAERGFDIASQSTTNYPYTALVLASMFNMRHLDQIDVLNPIPETHVGQTQALGRAINESPAIELLEDRGYWTVSAGLTEVRGTIRNVDEYIDGGQIRLWERQVLQRTSLWHQLRDTIIISQHRALIHATFDAVTIVAGTERDEPTFMFAHVMAPHTPIVFGRDGEAVKLNCRSACGDPFHIDANLIGLSRESFGSAMADQIHYLNGLVLRAVDEILSASPSAIVIVFSDHGARFETDPTSEWFHSFFAARTPGQGDLFGEGARPIEVFPRLFDAYFDMSVEIPADRSFWPIHRLNRPLLIVPWDREGAVSAPDPRSAQLWHSE